jgi:hypothetical protein
MMVLERIEASFEAAGFEEAGVDAAGVGEAGFDGEENKVTAAPRPCCKQAMVAESAAPSKRQQGPVLRSVSRASGLGGAARGQKNTAVREITAPVEV